MLRLAPISPCPCLGQSGPVGLSANTTGRPFLFSLSTSLTAPLSIPALTLTTHVTRRPISRPLPTADRNLCCFLDSGIAVRSRQTSEKSNVQRSRGFPRVMDQPIRSADTSKGHGVIPMAHSLVCGTPESSKAKVRLVRTSWSENAKRATTAESQHPGVRNIEPDIANDGSGS